MSLKAWIITYSFDLIFWLWIIFWGGADWIKDSIIGGYLSLLDTDSIRWMGWIFLIWSTIWFIIGLFTPNARFQYLIR
jgi:hypothetical protein